MSNLIQLLPDHIANQIAAGEVVQRPASVVKELLENAVDAGAQNIRLILKDAGKTLIQVVDDGIGMSDLDARLCFVRHATSKLRDINDLFALRTMGFRGEALASIAAVAQVELKTKQRTEELGMRLVVEDSEIKIQEPCQTSAGTSIAVKNLFYNVPARRNFLKSNTIELRHALDEFHHLALAHPDIFFTVYHNDDKLFHLPPSNLRQRIVGLFGNKINKALIPIEEETDVLRISGFIGKPEQAKKTRGEQFFFVNDRFIKSNFLNHALMAAYEDLLAKNLYPFYVIFFELDPSRIDVNVHPTKQEIKFEDERLVYNYLRVTARHALAQNSVTPSIDFDSEVGLSQHLDSSRWQQVEGTIGDQQVSKPFTQPQNHKSGSGYTFGRSTEGNGLQERNLKNWEKLYEGLNMPKEEEILSSRLSKSQSLFKPQETHNPTQRQLYQLHNTYIISPIKSGFLLINQRAAHKRILYERYHQRWQQQEPVCQKLLFPQTLNFSVNDALLVQDMLPQLKALGVDLEPFGNHSFVIHGMPPEASKQNEQQFLEGLLQQYKDNLELKLDIHENMLRALASQMAVPLGKPLPYEEMQQMVDELFACSQPHLSPEGQKVFIALELDEVQQRFGV